MADSKMNIEISIQEMMRLTGKTERRCEQIAKECRYRYIKGRGRNGQRLRVWLFSLPLKIQKNYWQDKIKGKDYPDYKVAPIWDRLSILIEVDEAVANPPHGRKVWAVQDVCRKNKICVRTYRDWLARFRAEGIEGLMPRFGQSCLDHRLKKNRKIVKFLHDFWADQNMPTISQTKRALDKYCEQHDLLPWSRHRVQTAIEKLPESQRELGRKGKRVLDEKYGYHLERDWNGIEVNRLWCSDHRQFDLFVYQTEYSEKPIRPWLTIWIDGRSRCITGWYISLKPNSDTIALALKKGILKYGRPWEAYIDNGKDFRCHYLNGGRSKKFKVDMEIERRFSILTSLQIKCIFAQPYHPQSKFAENTFKFISIDFDNKLPGWCGRKASERPEKLMVEIEKRKLLTLDQLRQKFGEWVAWYNTERVHSAIRTTPESLYKNVKIIIPEERALNFILMKRELKRLRRRGFRVNGCDYWNMRFTRMKFEKDFWTVCYDPEDVRFIYVFDGDKYICKAKIDEAVMARPVSERAMRRLKRIKRDERKQIQKYYASRVHPTAAEKVLQEIRAEETPKEQRNKEVRPVTDNILTLITPEVRMAKQLAEQESGPETEPVEMRKTGTDDIDWDAREKGYYEREKRRKEEEEQKAREEKEKLQKFEQDLDERLKRLDEKIERENKERSERIILPFCNDGKLW